MNKRITVRIEGKSYDITISDQADKAVLSAIGDLEALGENIGVKRLLEAYLAKSALAEKLQAELKEIEKLSAKADLTDTENGGGL
jgi:hypothetical protein